MLNEIKLVFNTTEFLIMMAFDLYACSIFAHFRFEFTFFLNVFLLNLTLFSSPQCRLRMCRYALTRRKARAHRLWHNIEIQKCVDLLVLVSLVRVCSFSSRLFSPLPLSHTLFILDTHFYAKLLRRIANAPNVRGRQMVNRIKLMECVQTSVAIGLCMCECVLWVSGAFACVCLMESKTSSDRFKMVSWIQQVPCGKFSKSAHFKSEKPLSIRFELFDWISIWFNQWLRFEKQE